MALPRGFKSHPLVSPNLTPQVTVAKCVAVINNNDMFLLLVCSIASINLNQRANQSAVNILESSFCFLTFIMENVIFLPINVTRGVVGSSC